MVICQIRILDIHRKIHLVRENSYKTPNIFIGAPLIDLLFEKVLLFLLDAFPYFEKYLVTDYLPKLVERIAFMMKQHQLNTPRDKALLLDYKAELIAWTMDSARQCLASYAIAREKFLNQNAT